MSKPSAAPESNIYRSVMIELARAVTMLALASALLLEDDSVVFEAARRVIDDAEKVANESRTEAAK
jgi:hypothetical protein